MIKGRVFYSEGMRSRCLVRLETSGVMVSPDEQSKGEFFYWDRLSLKLGGAADRLIFFTPSDSTEIQSFYIEKSKQNLEALRKIEIPQTDALFSQVDVLPPLNR